MQASYAEHTHVSFALREVEDWLNALPVVRSAPSILMGRSLPPGQTAVRYLARYVNKTALSEPRLLGYDEGGNIQLNCQDSKTGRWHSMTLSVNEFLRRCCLPVLPEKLVRKRHYGFNQQPGAVQ